MTVPATCSTSIGTCSTCTASRTAWRRRPARLDTTLRPRSSCSTRRSASGADRASPTSPTRSGRGRPACAGTSCGCGRSRPASTPLLALGRRRRGRHRARAHDRRAPAARGLRASADARPLPLRPPGRRAARVLAARERCSPTSWASIRRPSCRRCRRRSSPTTRRSPGRRPPRRSARPPPPTARTATIPGWPCRRRRPAPPHRTLVGRRPRARRPSTRHGPRCSRPVVPRSRSSSARPGAGKTSIAAHVRGHDPRHRRRPCCGGGRRRRRWSRSRRSCRPCARRCWRCRRASGSGSSPTGRAGRAAARAAAAGADDARRAAGRRRRALPAVRDGGRDARVGVGGASDPARHRRRPVGRQWHDQAARARAAPRARWSGAGPRHAARSVGGSAPRARPPADGPGPRRRAGARARRRARHRRRRRAAAPRRPIGGRRRRPALGDRWQRVLPHRADHERRRSRLGRRCPTPCAPCSAARVDRLPPAGAQLLALAAVAGPLSTLPVLVAASELDADEALDAADVVVAAGLLREDGAGRLVTPHALVRHAVLGRLTGSRRRTSTGGSATRCARPPAPRSRRPRSPTTSSPPATSSRRASGCWPVSRPATRRWRGRRTRTPRRGPNGPRALAGRVPAERGRARRAARQRGAPPAGGAGCARSRRPAAPPRLAGTDPLLARPGRARRGCCRSPASATRSARPPTRSWSASSTTAIALLPDDAVDHQVRLRSMLVVGARRPRRRSSARSSSAQTPWPSPASGRRSRADRPRRSTPGGSPCGAATTWTSGCRSPSTPIEHARAAGDLHLELTAMLLAMQDLLESGRVDEQVGHAAGVPRALVDDALAAVRRVLQLPRVVPDAHRR